MKILVTGASGYIGRHIVDELINLGHTVYAADIKTDGINEKAILTQYPIFSGEKDVFEKTGSPDVCIHTAWRDGFKHNSDAHIMDLPLHYRFIKDMYEAGLKHMVVMGSMHEVGYYEGAIDESTPANPQSLYGIAKNSLRLMTDILAKEYNAKYSWIRGYYIYGDDLKNHSVFTKIIEMEKAGEKTFPFTSGKNKYDFIDVKELATQISAVALQTEITGVINCCSGKPVSLADKMEEFIKEYKLSIKLEYGKFPDRPYDSPEVWGNSSKIEQIMENRK